MRRTIVIIILVVACVGYFRGWFHVSSDTTGDKSNVTLTVDKNKIQDDKKAADEKAHDMVQHPQK
jgi:hypothetical protein